MKTRVIYVEGHKASTKQANGALESLKNFGWDAELFPGVTPKTLTTENLAFPYHDLPGGRFEGFRSLQPHTYRIKKSCLINHLKFCEAVLDEGEPMALVEHDAVAIGEWKNLEFDEFCFLSYQYAFKPPSCLATKGQFKKFGLKGWQGINDFPANYPVKIHKPTSIYNGKIQVPGTGAYALTPEGALRILNAVKENGMEQSDFTFNSHNIKLQYVWPSPMKYAKVNLNLSHKLKEE